MSGSIENSFLGKHASCLHDDLSPEEVLVMSPSPVVHYLRFSATSLCLTLCETVYQLVELLKEKRKSGLSGLLGGSTTCRCIKSNTRLLT